MTLLFSGDFPIIFWFYHESALFFKVITNYSFHFPGKVDLKELKKIDLSTIDNYVTQLRHDPARLRNVTFDSSWVWADEDDMLKYEKNGYFEDYHAR